MVKLKEIPIIFVSRIKSYIFNWYIEYIILLRIVKVIIVYALKCEGLPRVYSLFTYEHSELVNISARGTKLKYHGVILKKVARYFQKKYRQPVLKL